MFSMSCMRFARFQCELIVAGNYDDEKSMKRHYHISKGVLARSREFQNVRFIASSLFNMGNSYYRMGNLTAHSN